MVLIFAIQKKESLKGFNMISHRRSLWKKKHNINQSLKGFNRFVSIGILILAEFTLFTACQPQQANKQQVDVYYTCSMHPQIHKDEPGNCPICGMKLMEVKPSVNKDKMPLDSALSYLTEPVTQTSVGFFKVIEPIKTNSGDTITAEGYIGFDRRGEHKVNTRVTGRIEKLYVSYTNQRIHKGQPLMEIYSPELLRVQRNLVQVMQDKDQTLIKALKAQLLNLGMQKSEIQKVMQSKKPLSPIIVYSSYNGISRQTNLEPSDRKNTTELLNIREGMYVKRGQTVFSIQKVNTTWAILNVFTENVTHLQPGNPVSLYADVNPKVIVKRKIDFIPPYRKQNEKTTRVRVYLNSMPDSWKIGTLIHGRIAINEPGKGWYIPLSAVNRLGMHNIIWVQDKEQANVFHAREVETGLQAGDSIEVISGINPGDKVAANAAYMVGSESFIE